ncbi:hypothetical protein B0H13DRAFT_515537 [Mycena leptocephala]|nr:hypothetical protein B0H13DRAFT_515537 [Mycena leptocephala]
MACTTIRCTFDWTPDIMLMRKWDASFEYMAAGMDDETRRQKYEFPPEIERQPDGPRPTEVSVDRCGGRHFFVLNHPTGIHENQTNSSWYDSFDKDFVSAENVLTMRTGLQFRFHSSNFSVDVDDRHRIVILRDMDPALSLLPTHLPRHSTHNAKVDTFLLRDHFKYSLGGMVLGGILETYNR